MENKLNYSEKIDEITKLQNEFGIDFKVKLIENHTEDVEVEHIVPAEAVENSGNILDVALKLEDLVADLDNDISKIEIVYSKDNKALWSIDTDKVMPEITDDNFDNFIKYVKSIKDQE